MLEAYDPAAVPMPAGVPEPGIYADGALDRQARSAADLASVATGWTMLHEIAHIQHQQEGTGAPQGASRDTIHDEELSCDAFATTYMLERAEDYAEAEGVEAHRPDRRVLCALCHGAHLRGKTGGIRDTPGAADADRPSS